MCHQDNNVNNGIGNDNDRFPLENNNDIDNDNNANVSNIGNGKRANYGQAKSVDAIANELVKRFNNPSGYRFYCKIAWRLSPAVIWNCYEQALNGRNPIKLFSYLCKKCIGQ